MACSIVCPALGEVREDAERLLEARRRLAIRGACQRLGARLAEIADRLLPHLAAEGVVGEPFDVLGQALPVEPLDGLDDPGVEGYAAGHGGTPSYATSRVRVCLKVYSTSGVRRVS